MSGRRFGILTIMLVLVIIFCIKGTAVSMGNEQRAEENYYYLALEQEYVQNAREYLNGQGFDNCGVTMNRVTNGDGSREYMVRIHHRRLEGMAEEDKAAMKNRLSQAEFGEDVCTFQYDLCYSSP